ncbi:MAG: hypothetical protein JXD23_13265 [Spirochaetales bacterium]|nr:hypothetical protein [Spirochaetales bacterium]
MKKNRDAAPATLFLGTFNSERFWRDPLLSRLPAVKDPEAERITGVMDDMQFLFVRNPGDIVVTRLPFHPAHREYLSELGFDFSNNTRPLNGIHSGEHPRDERTVCRDLIESDAKSDVKSMIKEGMAFSPYAVHSHTIDFAREVFPGNVLPAIECVKKVNSKEFSCGVARALFPEYRGRMAWSAGEVLEIGKSLLDGGPFLMKDPFGVSGKDNLLIQSAGILSSVARHILNQEKKGAVTRFLLEPHLRKTRDFSCQFFLDKEGNVHNPSLSILKNRGFSFQGVFTADELFTERMKKQGYFDAIMEIAGRIHAAGYSGPVCVDSMVLKDGSPYPLVEINARKSLGFFNRALSRFLHRYSKKACLVCFPLTVSRTVPFEKLLRRMKEENVLFTIDAPAGIIPLTAHTLNINAQERPRDGALHKARLYAGMAYEKQEDIEDMLLKMEKIFSFLQVNNFLKKEAVIESHEE